jgi:hypothetical protein
LVELGLSGAAMFGAHGEVLQPAEALYNRPVVLARGSFRPVCRSHLDILQSARADLGAVGPDLVELCELTMRNLRDDRTEVDSQDFLLRADMLAAVGKTVLISDYFQFERLASFVGRYTKSRTAFVIGAGTLPEIFGPRTDLHSEGEQLDALAQLFRDGLRLLVYPRLDSATGEQTTSETFDPGSNMRSLYRYLLERGLVRSIPSLAPECLAIFSQDVLAKISGGAEGWEQQVPAEVATLIQERRAFGYRPRPEKSAA